MISLMAESEDELNWLLMRMKEESEKSSLKLSKQKPKIMASLPIISWQIDGENVETDSFYFPGLQNHYSPEIKRHLLLGGRPWQT